jgi:small subunit ribosomal protein S6
MFILDSNRFAREGAVMAGEVQQLIEKQGGELLVSRLWDDRRLAYPIGGHKKGAYWLTYFRIDSLKLTSLTREMHLNDSIIRNMFVKIDPRLVDVLVEHAKTGTAAPEARPGAGAELSRPKPTVASVAQSFADDETAE